MTEVTKIFIVDDSQIHLEGLKLILRPHSNFKIVGETNSTKEALDLLKNEIPDIAILDISLEKDMDGIELALAIKNTHSETKIIFLSHHKEVSYLVNALRAGASAYLAKDMDPEELIHAINATKEGKGVYFGDTIPLAVLLETFGSEDNLTKNKIFDLTNREVEVIKYLAKGYSTKEIASILDIEVNTVESHKERIKEKLNVKTIIQIVILALKKGIITLDD
ncbi:MAG: response regulator transcription factor [Prevotellaceae bacterium]|jgi:two-component system response regulator NreC|nr:response regulator transcription factor [Prevotellaceae bacterium]